MKRKTTNYCQFILLHTLLITVYRAQSADVIYRQVGSDVTLESRYSGRPTEINWKVNGDKLVDLELIPALPPVFYHLRDRATIDVTGRTTGFVTIKNLTKEDSKLYKSEALVDNRFQETDIRLIVRDRVSKPTIPQCTTEGKLIVSCETSTPDVTYKWLARNGTTLSREQTYTPGRETEEVILICIVDNKVSHDSSNVTIAPPSPGPVYVKTGSDVTRCDMECPDVFSVLMLSRRCGGEKEILTEPLDNRLHLDLSRYCWTLLQAERRDSCVYEVRDRGAGGDKVLSSTSIRVLDPVLIYNISSTSSRLGEDIAVTVQFSGEESHVTWELDGGRLPERYRLIDDNRTLIIPSVQRDDAERTFRVRVTNPVSNVSQDYRLEITEPAPAKPEGGCDTVLIAVGVLILVAVGFVIAVCLYICYKKKKPKQQTQTENTDPDGKPLRNGGVEEEDERL
ncbi:uncharacterized protein [Hyperolius riggenbachi]|uniref:uncharacterized protein n=1 Tax=Hyperolius riggenbachi TaxID=752182 RepID=UPI0035A3C572